MNIPRSVRGRSECFQAGLDRRKPLVVIPTERKPLVVIPTERSERRNLGSIPATGTRMPATRFLHYAALRAAPVEMTSVSKQDGQEAEHDKT